MPVHFLWLKHEHPQANFDMRLVRLQDHLLYDEKVEKNDCSFADYLAANKHISRKKKTAGLDCELQFPSKTELFGSHSTSMSSTDFKYNCTKYTYLYRSNGSQYSCCCYNSNVSHLSNPVDCKTSMNVVLHMQWNQFPRIDQVSSFRPPKYIYSVINIVILYLVCTHIHMRVLGIPFMYYLTAALISDKSDWKKFRRFCSTFQVCKRSQNVFPKCPAGFLKSQKVFWKMGLAGRYTM